MPRSRKIVVTQTIINKAIELDKQEKRVHICARCVITLAVQKAFRTKDVFTAISITKVDGVRYDLPDVASDLARHTPSYWSTLKPFEFRITKSLGQF